MATTEMDRAALEQAVPFDEEPEAEDAAVDDGAFRGAQVAERVQARRWVELAAGTDGEDALSGLVHVTAEGVEATDGFRIHRWEGRAGEPGIEPVLTRKAKVSAMAPLFWPTATAALIDRAVAGRWARIGDPVYLWQVCRALKGSGRAPLAPALLTLGQFRVALHPGYLADALSFGGKPVEGQAYELRLPEGIGPVAVLSPTRPEAIAVIQLMKVQRGWAVPLEAVGRVEWAEG